MELQRVKGQRACYKFCALWTGVEEWLDEVAMLVNQLVSDSQNEKINNQSIERQSGPARSLYQ